ncbi:hypothetical protein [Nocardia arthritidis]|uniref:Uncharacterized protein n=1 Tax=Nocardia arthritidis TaxID=228602 RepID=A0A6G9YCH6_9NOCA|nr:hypothetical protein [Nocardia arthritidis]QIS10713.1 hypothetical protein F5544_14130 [Nocardia arthritidis]
MRFTAGISAERTIARAVLLPDATDEAEHLRFMELRGPGGVDRIGPRSVLDQLAAEIDEPDTIDDVGVVYRTAEERRAMVAELASGAWHSASLVSVRSALLAAIGNARELDDFGTVAAFDVAEHQVTFVVVGADRDRIVATGSWRSTVAAAGVADAITRAWRSTDTAELRLDAAIVCGSLAGESAMSAVRRLGSRQAPIEVRYRPEAVTRGAALVAAGPRHSAPVPISGTRSRGPMLAFGCAALAVAIGLIAIRVETGRASVAHAAGVPVALPTPGLPHPPPAPPPPAVTIAAPAPEISSIPTQPVATDAPGPTETPTATTQPPTTVGAPNIVGLFPSESPPPPIGAGPTEWQTWWDNHLKLNRQWLNGG